MIFNSDTRVEYVGTSYLGSFCSLCRQRGPVQGHVISMCVYISISQHLILIIYSQRWSEKTVCESPLRGIGTHGGIEGRRGLEIDGSFLDSVSCPLEKTLNVHSDRNTSTICGNQLYSGRHVYRLGLKASRHLW